MKYFEIRDNMTFIPVVAIRTDDKYLARRAGYFYPTIILIKLTSGECQTDYGAWNTRTMQIAHNHIDQNWETLENEQVIDVEYILGDTKEPKVSERHVAG